MQTFNTKRNSETGIFCGSVTPEWNTIIRSTGEVTAVQPNIYAYQPL